jgi:hypothetical protein
MRENGTAPHSVAEKTEVNYLHEEVVKNLPKGAMELLIALSTPAPQGFWGIPTLLWGAPGSGKSSFVESMQRERFPVYTLIASLHDPTDFNGLPFAKGNRTHFLVPAWVEVFEKHKQGILFLDEINTAAPAVQAALLRLVLERRLGSYQLPAGVRVVAAANPPEWAPHHWEIALPLANRFLHIEWEMPVSTFLHALLHHYPKGQPFPIDPQAHAQKVTLWKQVVAAFIKLTPDHLQTQPTDTSLAFASPRTWEYLIALLATCDLLEFLPIYHRFNREIVHKVFQSLVYGTIGEAAGTAFVEFVYTRLHLPDPEDILEGRAPLPPSLRLDQAWTLLEALTQQLQQTPSDHPRLPNRLTHFLRALLRFLELENDNATPEKTSSQSPLPEDELLEKILAEIGSRPPEKPNSGTTPSEGTSRADIVFPFLQQLMQNGWLKDHADSETHIALLRQLSSYFKEPQALLIEIDPTPPDPEEIFPNLEDDSHDLPF